MHECEDWRDVDGKCIFGATSTHLTKYSIFFNKRVILQRIRKILWVAYCTEDPTAYLSNHSIPFGKGFYCNELGQVYLRLLYLIILLYLSIYHIGRDESVLAIS